MTRTKRKATQPRVEHAPVLQPVWRTDDRVRMSAKAAFGMPPGMKDALRLAAEKLTKLEGRRVSMSEVCRRYMDAGGITMNGLAWEEGK